MLFMFFIFKSGLNYWYNPISFIKDFLKKEKSLYKQNFFEIYKKIKYYFYLSMLNSCQNLQAFLQRLMSVYGLSHSLKIALLLADVKHKLFNIFSNRSNNNYLAINIFSFISYNEMLPHLKLQDMINFSINTLTTKEQFIAVFKGLKKNFCDVDWVKAIDWVLLYEGLSCLYIFCWAFVVFLFLLTLTLATDRKLYLFFKKYPYLMYYIVNIPMGLLLLLALVANVPLWLRAGCRDINLKTYTLFLGGYVNKTDYKICKNFNYNEFRKYNKNLFKQLVKKYKWGVFSRIHNKNFKLYKVKILISAHKRLLINNFCIVYSNVYLSKN